MKEYTLTLTEEQAKVVANACEFYMRMRVGQWNRLVEECLDFKIPVEEYCQRRDEAEAMLLRVRQQVMPELTPFAGHSHGYGKFENADMAYDIYQVIRHADGDKPPFSYHSLPKIEVKTVEKKSK